MGAAGDHSPGRHGGSPKRRRSDSRSPSRKERRYGSERQQESSRHNRDRSRERSRQLSSRHDRDPELGRRHDRSDRHSDRRDHYDRDHQERKERDRKADRDHDRRDRTDRRDDDRHEPSQLRRHEHRDKYDRHRDEDDKYHQQQTRGLQGTRGPTSDMGPSSSGRQGEHPHQRQGRRKDAGDEPGNGKQRWGKPEEWAADEAAAAPPTAPKQQPNMGLSGKLAAESNKTVDGTAQLKYQPPPEARVCKQPPWRLYVFKGQEEAAPPITLNQTPFYLFGKDRKVADIPTDHPSCSRQHAVLCFREVEVDGRDGIAVIRVVKPYIIDLESVNGTHLNGERLEAARYYEVLHQDVIKFGLSSREYVMMNETAV